MKIVILTGAGISKESGIPTFRDAGGLWNNFKVGDIATPKAFKNNPMIASAFYNNRRQEAKKCEPNAAHFALAELQKHFDTTIITQNVDDLHERAGSKVLHMHGSLSWKICSHCNEPSECIEDINIGDKCEDCGSQSLRPHIVLFGERPLFGLQITNALEECDLFVSIGTSGNVYPAADFVCQMNKRGVPTVELNLEKTCGNFKVGIYGKATKIVPEWVNLMLEEFK